VIRRNLSCDVVTTTHVSVILNRNKQAVFLLDLRECLDFDAVLNWCNLCVFDIAGFVILPNDKKWQRSLRLFGRIAYCSPLYCS
jgi:hypothetical protein